MTTLKAKAATLMTEARIKQAQERRRQEQEVQQKQIAKVLEALFANVVPLVESAAGKGEHEVILTTFDNEGEFQLHQAEHPVPGDDCETEMVYEFQDFIEKAVVDRLKNLGFSRKDLHLFPHLRGATAKLTWGEC